MRLLRVNCCARRPERPLPGGDAARRERIRRIKEEIKAGTYETSEKLEIAIDRLIEDLRRREKK